MRSKIESKTIVDTPQNAKALGVAVNTLSGGERSDESIATQVGLARKGLNDRSGAYCL